MQFISKHTFITKNAEEFFEIIEIIHTIKIAVRDCYHDTGANRDFFLARNKFPNCCMTFLPQHYSCKISMKWDWKEREHIWISNTSKSCLKLRYHFVQFFVSALKEGTFNYCVLKRRREWKYFEFENGWIKLCYTVVTPGGTFFL